MLPAKWHYLKVPVEAKFTSVVFSLAKLNRKRSLCDVAVAVITFKFMITSFLLSPLQP